MSYCNCAQNVLRYFVRETQLERKHQEYCWWYDCGIGFQKESLLEEYAAMAKLTDYINRRLITEFENNWRASYTYYK